MTGTVIEICISPVAGGRMQQARQVKAIAYQGLEGDRYARGEGNFNKGNQGNRQVTLMNSVFFTRSGFEFYESRRNILVKGVDLMELIDKKKEFWIGKARFRAVKYCDPCSRPSNLARKSLPFNEIFLDQGGLIAEVILGGIIKVGDPVITPAKEY